MLERIPELSQWTFVNSNNLKLDLGVNNTLSHGTQVLSVFSPFWMVNKTGKDLFYRSGGQETSNVFPHPVEKEAEPVMFSYSEKTFLGKEWMNI